MNYLDISVKSINCKNIEYSFSKKFFLGYDKAILIEDDKDTYEDLMKIICSGNSDNQFFIYYIELDGKLLSASLSFISRNIINNDFGVYRDAGVIIYIY